MTDRLAGVIVTFDQDVRADDAEATIAALKQIKGVASVKPEVAEVVMHMATERARWELREKLWEALKQ